MSHDQSQHDIQASLEDLAAMYVAGAMSIDEVQLFEQRLESDAEARAAVKSFDDVNGLMLQDVSTITPDPTTKANLLARIEEDQKTIKDKSSEVKPFILRADQQDWKETGIAGITYRMLFADLENKRMTVLIQLVPGSIYPSHVHDQPEECLILEGDLDFGDYVLNAGDYLRLDVGTSHGEARTKQGCICLVTAELVPGWLAA